MKEIMDNGPVQGKPNFVNNVFASTLAPTWPSCFSRTKKNPPLLSQGARKSGQKRTLKSRAGCLSWDDVMFGGFAPRLNFDPSHLVQSDGPSCQLHGWADLPPSRARLTVWSGAHLAHCQVHLNRQVTCRGARSCVCVCVCVCASVKQNVCACEILYEPVPDCCFIV